MKISTRLSIKYSFIASLALIIFGVLVYLFTFNHNNQVFLERLNNRVIITEKMFLEKESFTTIEFEKIKDQFLHTLPQETEEVIELKPNISPVFKYHYPSIIKEHLLTNEDFAFKEGNTSGLSKVFNVHNKNYLIVVTAVDEVGIQNLSFLGFRIILLIIIAIPLIFLASFIITKRALRPLTDKIHLANSISASNLHERLQIINPQDEIGELATAFNKLLDRLEASFETQKSFISNASHEIKNPLTAIMGEAEITISKTREPDEYSNSLKVILNEAEKLNLTVNNLLQLSKVAAIGEIIQFDSIQFDLLLEETKESFDFINPENKVQINIKNEKRDYTITGNRNLLKTALINILDNACKFSKNDIVEVKLIQQKDWISLTVIDKGIGIDQKDIESITDPFFRGSNTIQITGSGIGLSLSDKIITLNKGELSIESLLKQGTTIEIKFPLA
jgi:signal transduction histidine kinase